VRPRSANEWRSFWHSGGDEELRVVLRDTWQPLHGEPDQVCARPAERIATLLGSNAPIRALASELGRIRVDELGARPDAAADQAAAEAMRGWFESRTFLDAGSPGADSNS
jgi:hypothetical protein